MEFDNVGRLEQLMQEIQTAEKGKEKEEEQRRQDEKKQRQFEEEEKKKNSGFNKRNQITTSIRGRTKKGRNQTSDTKTLWRRKEGFKLNLNKKVL